MIMRVAGAGGGRNNSSSSSKRRRKRRSEEEEMNVGLNQVPSNNTFTHTALPNMINRTF
jgi:hypothetical protein